MNSRLFLLFSVIASGCAHGAVPVTDEPRVAPPIAEPDPQPSTTPPPEPTATEAIAPAVVFTNRGFTDTPDDPNAPRSILDDLSSRRPDDVARMRAVQDRMPAIHACLLRAIATQTGDTTLHARIVADERGLAISSSPSSASFDACLVRSLASLELAGYRGVIAEVALLPMRYAHPLRVAIESPQPIGDSGLCFWFESVDCGPADDCLPDGFRPGICPAAAPALLRLVFGGGQDQRQLLRVERIGGDGRRSYSAATPLPISLEHGSTTLDLADADTTPRLTRTPIVSTGSVVAIVGDGGTLVVRTIDGEIRFSEPEPAEESLGFDDATGRISVGNKRCPFTEARHGRFAIACGDRIVVVRGGRFVYVFDERGSLLERRDLEAGSAGTSGRGLFPHVDVRIGDVRIEFDGRIYVH